MSISLSYNIPKSTTPAISKPLISPEKYRSQTNRCKKWMQHFLPQALNRAELSSENVWQSVPLLPSDRRLASLIKHQPLKWEVMPECFEETRGKKEKKNTNPSCSSPPTAPGTRLTPHLLIKSCLATWHLFKCTMSFHHLNAFPCLSVYLIPYPQSPTYMLHSLLPRQI